MGRGIVLVAEGATCFALLAAMAWDALVIEKRRIALQQPILKIVEGAHAGTWSGSKPHSNA